jgi:hypothetical protein
MTGSGKSGPTKGDRKRAERLKAALRDNLKRRKAQERARERARARPDANEHDSAGIGPEIAEHRPKG